MKRIFVALSLLVACACARAQTSAPSPVVEVTAAPSQTVAPTAAGKARTTPTPFVTATPSPTSTPRPATRTISVATYRSLLQKALDGLGVPHKKGKVNVAPLVRPLDAPFKVKREDGALQKVNGDEWNQVLSGLRTGGSTALSHKEVESLRGTLRDRLRALDDWTTKRGGSYYAPVNLQKVVDDAVASGQIRVGPPPLQRILGNISSAIGNAIDRFFKWLANLLPKPRASAPSGSLPDLHWLLYVFWGIVVGLLGLLLFLAVRALSGSSFALWGVGRRRKKSSEELRDEDAALFQLAPEELRDRADLFAAQGNFREALRHRFISLLVLLDARGTWRYDVRRTNWEHIAALRRDEGQRPLITPLSNLTRAFDRVRYGGAQCDENGWQQFQQGVREVESLVGGKAVAR